MASQNYPPQADSAAAESTQLPHLSISAHVVVQLGEELVTDIEQALLELAKNAYDADSTSCEIKVEPDWVLHDADPAYELLFAKEAGEPHKIGRVRIRDYGSGLSEDAVNQGWLRISSSLKRARHRQMSKRAKPPNAVHRREVGLPHPG